LSYTYAAIASNAFATATPNSACCTTGTMICVCIVSHRTHRDRIEMLLEHVRAVVRAVV